MSQLQSWSHALQEQISALLRRAAASGTQFPDASTVWDMLIKAPDGSKLSIVRGGQSANGCTPHSKEGRTGSAGKENGGERDKASAQAQSLARLTQKLAELTAAIEGGTASAPKALYAVAVRVSALERISSWNAAMLCSSVARLVCLNVHAYAPHLLPTRSTLVVPSQPVGRLRGHAGQCHGRGALPEGDATFARAAWRQGDRCLGQVRLQPS
jgi:hypothetical protein